MKKIVISMILVAMTIVSSFPMQVFAIEKTKSLEPEKIFLVSDKPDASVNSSSTGCTATYNGVSISTSKTYSDIQVKPYFSKANGVVKWDFDFAIGSNLAKYSKNCEGKTLMKNKVGTFMFKHGFKVNYFLYAGGGSYTMYPYTFNIKYLSYPDISTK